MENKKNTELISVYNLPERILKYVRIGTCSWNYPEWTDIGVYSRPAKLHYNYLLEYSKFFNTAEVDQWFWSLISMRQTLYPKQIDVQAYNDLTPVDFFFTVKAPNSLTLTHFYKQSEPELANKINPFFLKKIVLERFLSSLLPLKEKLGPVMFEFEYLNKDKMPSLNVFMEKLSLFVKFFQRDFKFAIETRNPNYIKPEFFKFLKSHKIGFVLIDGYYMPSIDKIYHEYENYLLSSEFIVIRLIGKDRAGIEKKTNKLWNKIVEPRDESIEKISQVILEIVSRKIPVYVNINNHFEGSAPLTAKKLITKLS
jgi:uncharacterized protein YecE (DUF72 family)